MKTQKNDRRFGRFGLTTLFVILSIASVIFAWLGMQLKEADAQRRIVAALRSSGFEVMYDYETELMPALDKFGKNMVDRNGDLRIIDPSPVPMWLRDLFGVDFFYYPTHIWAKDPTISDSDIALVAQCERLEQLYLSDTAVTNEGLSYLSALNNIRLLHVDGKHISDSGLQYISEINCLKHLIVEDSDITDAGLISVGRMLGLRVLWLWNNNISDTGIGYLTCLKQLQTLDLRGTNVSDAAIPYLSKLKNLEVVVFTNTRVTHKGIDKLRLPQATTIVDSNGKLR